MKAPRFHTIAVCRIGWLVLVCAQMLYHNAASAERQLSGAISGTLNAANGPYRLISTCTVASDTSLIVEAGTAITMGPGVQLVVSGGVDFRGTSSNRITVTGSNPNARWDTILVYPASGKTKRFLHTDFRDATNGLSFVVNVGTFAPTVQNCAFQNCNNAGIFGLSQGIIISGGMSSPCTWTTPSLVPSVLNCTFSDSRYGCLFVTTGYYGNCNSLYPGPAPGSASPRILNSVFRSIDTAAIVFEPRANSAASLPIVQNNTIIGCGNAITTADPFDARIVNNLIVSNLTAIVRTGQKSAKVSNNCFYANAANFHGYAGAALGIITETNRNGVANDIALNIFEDPRFNSTRLTVAIDSPVVDAGLDEASNHETCFPPARGGELPDIGAYGGSGSCNWPAPVIVTRDVPLQIGTVIELRFDSVKGASYTLFASHDLIIWTPTQSISGVGGEQQLHLPIGGTSRYFTLREVNEVP